MLNSDTILKCISQNDIQIKTILDLGCGSPIRNFALIDVLKPTKYVGVDFDQIGYKLEDNLAEILVEDKEINFREANKIAEKIRKEEEIYPFYEYYLKNLLESEEILSKDQFNNRFSFKAMPLDEYLDHDTEKFDLIILSKVLSHLDIDIEKNDEWVMRRSIAKLSKNGLIYLRVNGEGYETKPKEISGRLGSSFIRKTYTLDSISDITNRLKLLLEPRLLKVKKWDGRIVTEYELIGQI